MARRDDGTLDEDRPKKLNSWLVWTPLLSTHVPAGCYAFQHLTSRPGELAAEARAPSRRADHRAVAVPRRVLSHLQVPARARPDLSHPQPRAPSPRAGWERISPVSFCRPVDRPRAKQVPETASRSDDSELSRGHPVGREAALLLCDLMAYTGRPLTTREAPPLDLNARWRPLVLN